MNIPNQRPDHLTPQNTRHTAPNFGRDNNASTKLAKKQDQFHLIAAPSFSGKGEEKPDTKTKHPRFEALHDALPNIPGPIELGKKIISWLKNDDDDTPSSGGGGGDRKTQLERGLVPIPVRTNPPSKPSGGMRPPGY